MTPSEARERILDEAFGPDGLIVALRMGEDPGPERMARTLEAIRVLFADLRGAGAIDRRLADALFGLAYYGDLQVESWRRQGRSWRTELVDREMPALAMAVASVFADEWADLFA